MMQSSYELGPICAARVPAPVAVTSGASPMFSRHAAPAGLPLIKYSFGDVMSYCFHRALQSRCEEMQGGEAEGSLLHDGLITSRTLSLTRLNNRQHGLCPSLAVRGGGGVML